MLKSQGLTFDTISPIWAKKLEESKHLSLFCLTRLRLYLELKDTSKCVVGEAYGFSSAYTSSCKRCCKIGWKFMFYFMICSYSKLDEAKEEFVEHWSEMHHDYHHHNLQLMDTRCPSKVNISDIDAHQTYAV